MSTQQTQLKTSNSLLLTENSNNSYSLFEWMQLIVTIRLPVVIGIFTIIQHQWQSEQHRNDLKIAVENRLNLYGVSSIYLQKTYIICLYESVKMIIISALVNIKLVVESMLLYCQRLKLLTHSFEKSISVVLCSWKLSWMMLISDLQSSMKVKVKLYSYIHH